MLIIGGQNNKTEVIDLATGGAESCVSDVLAPHFSENAMGIFVGDKPTICGGWNWLAPIPEGYDVCWSLDPLTGQWEQFTNMPEIRYHDTDFCHVTDSKIGYNCQGSIICSIHQKWWLVYGWRL